jgi:hypothetical protein
VRLDVLEEIFSQYVSDYGIFLGYALEDSDVIPHPGVNVINVFSFITDDEA